MPYLSILEQRLQQRLPLPVRGRRHLFACRLCPGCWLLLERRLFCSKNGRRRFFSPSASEHLAAGNVLCPACGSLLRPSSCSLWGLEQLPNVPALGSMWASQGGSLGGGELSDGSPPRSPHPHRRLSSSRQDATGLGEHCPGGFGETMPDLVYTGTYFHYTGIFPLRVALTSLCSFTTDSLLNEVVCHRNGTSWRDGGDRGPSKDGADAQAWAGVFLASSNYGVGSLRWMVEDYISIIRKIWLPL